MWDHMYALPMRFPLPMIVVGATAVVGGLVLAGPVPWLGIILACCGGYMLKFGWRGRRSSGLPPRADA